MKNRAVERNTELEDKLVAGDPQRRTSGVQRRAKVSLPSPAPTQVSDAVAPMVSIGAPVNPALLEPTYTYLSAYCFACLPPPVAERINVAIYELYANALNHGSKAGEVRLELRQTPSGAGASLRISNSAEPEQLERLTAHMARVQSDPAAAFAAEMSRFARASEPPPMIGIVRVAHESALALELEVDGQRVTISTSCGT